MQYDRMGVYEQTEEYHNKKPIWSRHDGTQKMFYNSRKFPFTEMTDITNIDIDRRPLGYRRGPGN